MSEVIQTFKRYSTIEYTKAVNRGLLPPYDKRIWQRSYHDHIIRGDADYLQIWRCIGENPLKWEDDCFYTA